MALRSLFGGGLEWSLDPESDRVLPGTVVRGQVMFVPRNRLDTRGCVASLIGTEQWKYHETQTDAQGNSRTVVRTRKVELRRLPVQLMPAAFLEAGQQTTLPFEVPVPPLGPATFEGEVARMTWNLEVKLDMAGGIDPSVVLPIVVLQPTGLLAAGVVNTGQWGLWQDVEGVLGSVPYRLSLDRVPLCIGQPFSGTLELARELRGRELRLELKVRAEATVSGGLNEEHTLIRQALASGGLAEGRHALSGVLPEAWLPSVDLPHGRGRARLEVVIDRPFAPDDRISRDVALCSTREM